MTKLVCKECGFEGPESKFRYAGRQKYMPQHKCPECGSVHLRDAAPPHKHKWGDWTVSRRRASRECTICEHFEVWQYAHDGVSFTMLRPLTRTDLTTTDMEKIIKARRKL